MKTDELIQQLAGAAAPVRRLPRPSVRAAFWLAISLPYAAAVIFAKPLEVDLVRAVGDPRFLFEQAAALATALAAAVAAFGSVVPGYSRKLLLVPLIPLSLWLASIGEGCVHDWLKLGPEGLSLRPDWECLAPAALIGSVPAIVLVTMLRRGAPLRPRATIALAALAVGALGNFGLQLFHFGDISAMVLVWHLGGVAVLSAVAGAIATRIMGWRQLLAS